MERRQAIKLEDLLRTYLREEGIETPLNEFRAEQAWADVVEPVVARSSKVLSLRGGVLHVKVRSAVMRSELAMRKSHYVKLINEKVGAQVLQDIFFS